MKVQKGAPLKNYAGGAVDPRVASPTRQPLGWYDLIPLGLELVFYNDFAPMELGMMDQRHIFCR